MADEKQQVSQGALMNAMPVGIGVLHRTDDGFVFQNANARLRSMFHFENDLSVIGVLGQTQGKALNDLAFKAGGEVTVQKDNHWYSVSVTPFQGDEWLAVIKDVTIIKAEVAHAENLTEMKSHFLAMMSHEIRTPMQSIYGLLELISDEDGLNEDVHSMLGTAKTSATGLLEILDDILDIAKVDAGKMELDILEVPVRTLIYGVNECMEVKVQGKKVKLRSEVAEGVPFVVIGDPSRLRQVLLNLVGNALKFTEVGSITIRVTTECKSLHIRDDKKFGLRIEVIDTGIGMPQEVVKKLFQPFTQADSSTSRKFGGTGLGLSICQKLVELMDGVIGVDSVEGEGSTFWFEFPTQAAEEDTTQDLPDLSGLAVLSVEDHPNGAKEIERTLKMMGADVTSVPTYEEGLTMAKSRRFDVCLIDQGLPDGLGIDLMKEIDKLQPYAGQIMYTVRDDYGLQHSARALGAKYLSKPASRVGLGEAVKSAAKQNAVIQDAGRPKRLLIAEDTEAVRDVLSRQLKKLGVEADFVENGLQALQTLKEGRHGIIFTDLHMPEMDGYEVVKRIRGMEDAQGVSQHEGFPIVVLTADVQMAQKQAYLSYGFNECLLKPVSLGQFKQLLIRWGVLQEDEISFETKPEFEVELDFADVDEDRPQANPMASLDVSPVSEGEEVSEEDKQEPQAEERAPQPQDDTPDQPEAEASPEHETGKDNDFVYEVPDGPAIDPQAVEEMMGGFDDDTKEMMKMFVQMTTPQIENLRNVFDSGNASQIAELAHSLKGAARSACCPHLGDLAHKAQDIGDNGKIPEVELISAIEAEFERVKSEVDAL